MKKNRYKAPQINIVNVCNSYMLCNSISVTDKPADPNIDSLTGQDMWSGKIW